MPFPAATLVPFLVAISFAAGINTYATTVTLGLLGRMHWVALPSGLDVLQNPWVLGAGVVLFCCEFFADKIPYVDLVWNFAHTFVRLPVAALLAYRAADHLSPAQHALVVLLAAIVAGAAHTSKTGARALVNVSPEPVSNIAVSSAEDLGAIALTWIATRHPVAAGAAAAVLLLAAALAIRSIVAALKRQILVMRRRFAVAR